MKQFVKLFDKYGPKTQVNQNAEMLTGNDLIDILHYRAKVLTEDQAQAIVGYAHTLAMNEEDFGSDSDDEAELNFKFKRTLFLA